MTRVVGPTAAVFLGLLAIAAGDPRKSGYDFMSPALRAMQDDEQQNPGTLWVLDGAALWQAHCTECHGEAEKTMRGVAARLPRFDTKLGRVVDLEARINHSRKAPWPPESHELLALSAYIASLSRGTAIAISDDPATRRAADAGARLFNLRQGQLNLSCADCHDRRDGGSLGGATIPQAHPTGYPIYRLEWQSLGSLQRRLRGCIAGIRARPYDYGAPEMLQLETYLMRRAGGMTMDAPAVRP